MNITPPMYFSEQIQKAITLAIPESTTHYSIELPLPKPAWLPQEYRHAEWRWIMLRLFVENKPHNKTVYGCPTTYHKYLDKQSVAAALLLHSAIELDEYIQAHFQNHQADHQEMVRHLKNIYLDLINEARQSRQKSSSLIHKSIPRIIRETLQHMDRKKVVA